MKAKSLARNALTVLALIQLAGCTGHLKLVEDGKVHSGRYDQLSKSLEINVDGVLYRGSFVQGVSAGFGTAMTGTRVGISTVMVTDGSGQALLTSPEGKVLRCVFGPVVAWRGQGQCQTNEGRLFDLLIGQ
ncbi:hypothetical protein [Acidovorax sp. sic0104]|uniref:hypothetical protein n=1 Tax=Acidovorax sp. sic0104 TaxID=2854784 RepID=UPI001C4899D6|nr:hypothetical protein [Acidovorax sp. sic0104]MBV7539462.1 hypothetical protein [Acidovorax sp. sic0104]